MRKILTKEEALEICDAIIEDGLTCKDACARFKVKDGSFYYMLNKDAEVFEAYARAREVQCHRWIDEIITIADRPSGDSIDNSDKKIQVDTRKWAAAKALPKIYGDKLDVTSGGEKIKVTLPEWMNEGES